jgi:hypothetical protein
MSCCDAPRLRIPKKDHATARRVRHQDREPALECSCAIRSVCAPTLRHGCRGRLRTHFEKVYDRVIVATSRDRRGSITNTTGQDLAHPAPACTG